MIFDEVSWDSLKKRSQEIARELASGSLESSRRLGLQKESAHLSKLLDSYDELLLIEKEKNELKKQRDESDDEEIIALFNEELSELENKWKQVYNKLDLFLYPPDEVDNRSIFLEIRAGAGGKEAALFVADLLRMYLMYAAKKSWETSVTGESATVLGGYREVILHVKGKNVYGHLKYESGVHRVQRVPETEAAGRIHTSTATVAVLPEAKEVEIEIDDADLRIDTYRASGAGGQHVNRTDSAVRITHLPTGVVVSCQDERSQHKNRATAMKIIKSRLFAAQQKQQKAEISQKRKEQVGAGMRAEKVRTYNFPQNRVSDHQVNLTLKKLDRVMEGELDEIVEALMRKGREERRERGIAA